MIKLREGRSNEMELRPMAEERFGKKIAPFFLTHFFGVFNDNAFRLVTVLAAIGAAGSYSSDTAFMSLITIIYVLPFIVFPPLTGYLSDRFRKRQIMVSAKIAELAIMALGAVCLYYIGRWGPLPLVGVLLLMASQSAFFSPAYYGALPEVFHERDISRANGWVGMGVYLAIITGSIAGVVLLGLFESKYFCGILFSVLSLFGLIAALRIRPKHAASRDSSWDWNVFKKYVEGIKLVAGNRPILVAVLGEAFFLAMGAALQMMLLVFPKHDLGVDLEEDLGVFLLVAAAGMGLGCWLAGKMSRGKVELGLVPFGSLLLVVFIILVPLFPGPRVTFDLLEKTHVIYPQCLALLFMLGVGGGLFVIPMRSYIQYRSDPKTRGLLLANANLISFAATLLAGFAMFFLTSGTDVSGPESAGLISTVQSYCLALPPKVMFMCMAASTLLVSITAFVILPEFTLRFIGVTLTHSFYRIKVRGAENIPERGPALLISNHVSFVDGFLVSACTSRKVKFLMHEDYYRFPLFYPLVKFLGFIEVPGGKRPKAMKYAIDATREALENGDVVCIFPEGRITKNGNINKFHEGFTRMIPEDADIPLIPVSIGRIWGSIFSYRYGKVRPRIPGNFPHPAALNIGAPMALDTTPFEARQRVSELAAEMEIEEPWPGEMPIHCRFAKLAKRHPFRKTCADADSGPISNFGLFLRALILSREIRRLNPEGKYLGVLLPNSTHAVCALLAVLMADRVPAPLNFSLSGNILDDTIKNAGIKSVLTSRIFLKRLGLDERDDMVFLEDIAGAVRHSGKFWWALAALFIPRRELMNLVSPESSDDLRSPAVLIFSSGSSGVPKGVLLSHHNINSNVNGFFGVIGGRTCDIVTGNLPLFHSFGLTVSFWLPMMKGVKVVYMKNPLDAKKLGKALEKYGMTILPATPTFMQSYIRRCTRQQFSSVRMTVAGAEKLQKKTAEMFHEKMGILPIEGFGCTECSPVIAVNVPFESLDIGNGSGPEESIGQPIPGVAVKIVDPDSGEDLPPGTEGLMLVKGANVMLGYLGEPEKTEAAVNDGWYDTGDIAEMSESGHIFITGRLSRFSKIGGEMVPHELVEKTINEIIGAEDPCAAVCGVPDGKKGERLVVMYTRADVDPGEIISKMREKDIPNLWIPGRDAFYRVEEIPQLASGKLDLKKLKDTAREKEYGNSP